MLRDRVPAGPPAEWEPHDACWTAWPSHPAEWPGALDAARDEIAALCAALVAPQVYGIRGERVEVLIPPAGTIGAAADAESTARAALAGLPVRLRPIPFGDIWLRDTAPIFMTGAALSAVAFAFNGWGGKYLFAHDPELAERIAAAACAPLRRAPLTCEGGALEWDGEGTVITTRQCLLSPARNPGWTEADVEQTLRETLGARAIIWLDDGLVGDHTDGHIDTLARFVAPGRVVCMVARAPDDPNRDTLARNAATLQRARDAAGRRLEVVTIPSPGHVRDPDGATLPASFVNFYIGNHTVCVPTYGVAADDEAVAAIAALFPGRRTLGLSARALVRGGGALHCVTQQQPAIRALAARAPEENP